MNIKKIYYYVLFSVFGLSCAAENYLCKCLKTTCGRILISACDRPMNDTAVQSFYFHKKGSKRLSLQVYYASHLNQENINTHSTTIHFFFLIPYQSTNQQTIVCNCEIMSAYAWTIKLYANNSWLNPLLIEEQKITCQERNIFEKKNLTYGTLYHLTFTVPTEQIYDSFRFLIESAYVTTQCTYEQPCVLPK